MKIEFDAKEWKRALRLGTVIAFWLTVFFFTHTYAFWFGAHEMVHYIFSTN